MWILKHATEVTETILGQFEDYNFAVYVITEPFELTLFTATNKRIKSDHYEFTTFEGLLKFTRMLHNRMKCDILRS